ncbi:ankyrin repeat-containing domain protein [Talaromyces proteolyticus]|uniref:Ankyrin repeat-containing domain protein n=1 Tax=Talaromyces proteolyticus TaxID=1131652 RepID=A0AAD4KV81_9EURO|nr:ankyrin repeat-containing domain protein [Talaromyces proteolyticus]KAH8701832.1 ankyrin repeat-containing domain protein [Talaromyces proteolyticus]
MREENNDRGRREERQTAYDYFRTNRPICLYDQNGAILYENNYQGLRNKIVQLNDVALLKQYIVKYPRAVLAAGEVYYHDPFFIAAECGSTDALRLLFNVYIADPTQAKALDKRGYRLLDLACQNAHIDTVRFLLNNEPPLGDVLARNKYGDTALLSAAASLARFRYEDWEDNDFSMEWIRDRFARSEDLMQLLLDRGASARDSNTTEFFREDYDEYKSQPRDTVLGLAVSRASPSLVKRLIDEGADVHRRDWHLRMNNSSFGGSYIDAINVTVLHLASSYWNVGAIKVLLQHRGSELLSSSDSIGRLPIHWAAAGPMLHNEYTIPEHEIDSRIIETFKLLLTGNSDMINVKDKEGMSALYYAVGSHAGCGIGHLYLLIKFLLDKGANVGLQNSKGQSVLHILALNSIAGEPINTALIDLLLSYGADISQTDMNGDTVLHIMAKNLRQVEATRSLLSKGADVRAINAKGNTPFHEVMVGLLRSRVSRRQKTEPVTLADRLRTQNEMIAVLQDGNGYSDTLMDQPNAAGKTPRQLLEETRARWQNIESEASRPRSNQQN